MATISVIVPVFNRESYLREALESVLGQSRPADEIIVVDDGSTDGSAEIARSFGGCVRCVSQANQGISAARNAGLAVAQGDLIAFLDSDDLWTPNKLEVQANFLAARPEVDLVFCRMKPFLSPEIDPVQVALFDLSEKKACVPSALLAHRKVFDRSEKFEIGLRVGDFISWFDRAQQHGLRTDAVPELLVMRRVHLGNSVHDHAARSDYLHILKRRIDRHRAVGEARM